MSTSAAEGTVPTAGIEYAGFWRRLIAFAIDVAITCLVFFALVVLLPIVLGPLIGVPRGGFVLALGGVVWLAVVWLYWAAMESSSRRSTVGKDLLGIVVTDGDGNRISFGKATLRCFGKAVSVLPFMAGFLIIFFTARKQGLHDLISGSLVVTKRQQDT